MSIDCRTAFAAGLVAFGMATIRLSAPAIACAKEKPPVVKQGTCKQSALKQTQEMIRTILNDLTKTYTRSGGGGISRIEQKATYTYVISIAQEERVDQITYELSIGSDCKATIVRRTPAQ